jgi:hypothetical protein
MKFKVIFTINNKRKSGICSKYFPTWVSNSKPEHNGGRIILLDRDMLELSDTCTCLLEPFMPDLWKNVKIGDILKCMEGLKEVGAARVLSIEEE